MPSFFNNRDASFVAVSNNLDLEGAIGRTAVTSALEVVVDADDDTDAASKRV